MGLCQSVETFLTGLQCNEMFKTQQKPWVLCILKEFFGVCMLQRHDNISGYIFASECPSVARVRC